MPNSTFLLPNLSQWKKSQMLRYAEQVLTQQQLMQTKKGKNILHYTLEKKRKHFRFKHYPLGDRIDTNTGGQYFYHCHREDKISLEHGHFHCFLRKPFIQKHIKPKKLPDWDKNLDNPIVHLVAISMDQFGQPIRLFTVNRWVTDETWYDAKHLPKLLKRFKMTKQDSNHWQILDSWVEGMLHLFAPQITWLHEVRDQTMHMHAAKDKNSNIYENKEIEELSSIDINLSQQIQWLIT